MRSVTKEPDEYRQRDFEPFERGDVRDTLDERQFRKKAWKATAKYAGILAGIGAGILTLRDSIVAVAKAIVAALGTGS